jgi:hypothetical protein
MASVDITLATLGDLDGGTAGVMIDAALKAAKEDADDRGSDGKAREVVIKVKMKQLPNEQIETIVTAKATVPEYQTHATFCRLARRAGKVEVQFQQHNPERADQGTLPMIDEAKEGE